MSPNAMKSETFGILVDRETKETKHEWDLTKNKGKAPPSVKGVASIVLVLGAWFSK